MPIIRLFFNMIQIILFLSHGRHVTMKGIFRDVMFLKSFHTLKSNKPLHNNPFIESSRSNAPKRFGVDSGPVLHSFYDLSLSTLPFFASQYRKSQIFTGPRQEEMHLTVYVGYIEGHFIL
ncbi:uncharacterized protein PRCAT00004874001 [Priceomyces carsonii]|uniref:uncharacterized protein n=1 Tax=Priceomyces carsonii TaxID=28549 RepID=UPI002EDA7510|nr:unnamed protein product [Priceomyces carsonii]